MRAAKDFFICSNLDGKIKSRINTSFVTQRNSDKAQHTHPEISGASIDNEFVELAADFDVSNVGHDLVSHYSTTVSFSVVGSRAPIEVGDATEAVVDEVPGRYSSARLADGENI